MEFKYFCVFALIVCTANARRLYLTNPDMPIQFIDTSYGEGDHERIDYLEALIRPGHINNKTRLDFPRSGYLNDYFNECKADGDERGHLVASQFSGPAEWYNLSPQSPRVNRNMNYQALNTDWYGAECEVRQFLDQGGNRYVKWKVRMIYIGRSNRPDQYHLQVDFFLNGRNTNQSIDTRLRNPLLSQGSTFWICRTCNAVHNGQCTRG